MFKTGKEKVQFFLCLNTTAGIYYKYKLTVEKLHHTYMRSKTSLYTAITE
jgi:hypothetical protein